MFFSPPPPPPVSYSREVAPVLAMRCNACHGDAGGLSTRSYSTLMAGGNMGRVIVAGDAEHSLLVHFIDGRRGESHRMPLGGATLSARETEVIRRWIDEGAHVDPTVLPVYVYRRQAYLPAGRALRVECRLTTHGYLTMTVRDPRSGRVLLERVASVKSPREEADIGQPGDRVSWEVRPEPDWPATVEVKLTAEYTPTDPGDIDFVVRLQ